MGSTGQFIKKNNYYIIPFIVTVFSGLLSLYLHLYQYWSPLQLPESYWIEKLYLNLTYSPFAVRFVQSYAVILFKSIFSTPVRESFFIIQYGLLIILGLLFYKYIYQIFKEYKTALIGLILFLSSFPIMGAHFEPVFTWNDFCLYLFLLAVIINLINKKYITASVFYLPALLSHEQAIIYAPVLFIFLLKNNYKLLKAIIISSAPVLIFILYRIIVWEDIASNRWSLLLKNFASAPQTLDSLVSFFLTYGVVWFFAVFGIIHLMKKKSLQSLNYLIWSVLIVLPLNLIAVFCFANARETRLFYITYLLIIPLALIGLKYIWTVINPKNNKLINFRIFLFSTVTIIVMAAYISNSYLDYYYKANCHVRDLFFGIHLGAIISTMIMMLYSYMTQIIEKYTSKRRNLYKRYILPIVFIMIISTGFYNYIYPVAKGPTLIPAEPAIQYSYAKKVQLLNVIKEVIQDKTVELEFVFAITDPVEDNYLIYWTLKELETDSTYHFKFTPDPQFSLGLINDTIIYNRPLNIPKGDYTVYIDIYNEKGHLGWPCTSRIFID